MSIAEKILKLYDGGKGLGVRAIARKLERSPTQVSRVIKAAERKQSAGDVPALLQELARIVRSFAIEREGRVWKIVNYELRLGDRTETSNHADLAVVIREAISLWKGVPVTPG